MNEPRVRIIFLWHMHQPSYRDPLDGRYLLPWVRLHGLAGYSDMARALELADGVKCVTNFVPILVDQLEDYARGVAEDRFWELTMKPAEELTKQDKEFILDNFFSCRWETRVLPMPHYWQLLRKRETSPANFTTAELRDLQILFNLAWFGPSAREVAPEIEGLKARGRLFTEEDKLVLQRAQQKVLESLLPRWKKLQDDGKTELSVSPYYHPILPLLIDTDVARRTMPGCPLPVRFSFPEDAREQVERARRRHTEVFGLPPAGMWPSEGSVSPEAVEIIRQVGFKWTVTDEGVLMRSPGVDARREEAIYRPWYAPGTEDLVMFFRDRVLSDLIGFTYGRVAPQEAAEDLLNRLKKIPGHSPVVTIALDGENPWEGYSDDGQEFLARVFDGIAQDPELGFTTPSEVLKRDNPGHLLGLHSGSWIESNFNIWIGGQVENRAWTALAGARKAAAEHSDKEAAQKALEILLAAEGSDWFWWYGDQFTSVQDLDFDELFRRHLMAAYSAMGLEAPVRLTDSLVEGREAPKPGPAPTDLITPIIDGNITGFYEWTGAGRYEVDGNQGSMYRGVRYLKTLYYCFDLDHLYLRIDPESEWGFGDEDGWRIRLGIQTPKGSIRVEVPLNCLEEARLEGGGDSTWPSDVVAVKGDILEMAVPFGRMGVGGGEAIEVVVLVMKGKVALERYPVSGVFQVTVPNEQFVQKNWWV